MYFIPEVFYQFNIEQGTLGLVVAFISIVGATYYAIFKDLNESPATLMRPKAPQNGKRVFLELIPAIWQKLSFMQKVTMRNIFRYKKRFLMTIIGIAGCTALIITGFGIRDAVSSILPVQYGDILHYDMMMILDEDEYTKDYLNQINNNKKIGNSLEAVVEAGKLSKGETNEEVQIISPTDVKELDNFITLNSNLKNNEIIITSKVADLIKVKKGETVTLIDNEDNEHKFKISDITDNYLNHYVYMSKATYENKIKDYVPNVIYINTKNSEELVKTLIKDKEVVNIIKTSDIVNQMNDTLNSLNYVVWILIVSSGLLAFVVLYNLSNVNISERKRELATIKVLGFYDLEVSTYINRETIVLTIIGIGFGLLGGTYLSRFIMKTCETNALRFIYDIKLSSYFVSAVITIIFTYIVSIITFYSLKGINMIESLKSVE